MKLVICADIHRDAGSADERIQNLIVEKPDVLVHAGDLSSYYEGERSLQWLRTNFPDATIAIVPGNHDFYCNRRVPMANIINAQSELCRKYDVAYLQERPLALSSGVYLVGSALWYDYSFPMDRFYDPCELEKGESDNVTWNDMRSIDTGSGNRWWADWMLARLEEQFFMVPEDAKVIFASHFCPHPELNTHKPSLFGAYSGMVRAGRFLDKLEDRLIAAYCGHTHKPAKFGKYVNLGSDYYGPCRYEVLDVGEDGISRVDCSNYGVRVKTGV
jgi:Icc-related predicted phosphoesterase